VRGWYAAPISGHKSGLDKDTVFSQAGSMQAKGRRRSAVALCCAGWRSWEFWRYLVMRSAPQVIKNRPHLWSGVRASRSGLMTARAKCRGGLPRVTSKKFDINIDRFSRHYSRFRTTKTTTDPTICTLLLRQLYTCCKTDAITLFHQPCDRL
jgi:hypothetical protein